MFYFCLKLILLIIIGSVYARKGYGSGEQDWGFVDVRPGAHMFYWLYYTTANITNYTERPLVIWLEGGPFCASTQMGNFEFLGPLDIDGNYRNSNWIETHNVLFIDSPVGAGFSYVDDDAYFVSNNSDIARDLVEFMKHFYELHSEFEKVPLHIFGHSYAGKMAPEFALELYKAIQNNAIRSNLQSVTIGNPFTSPLDTLKVIPSVLFHWGIVDEEGFSNLKKNYLDYVMRTDLTDIINRTFIPTYNLDVYNVMNLKPRNLSQIYLCSSNELIDFMRGPVRKALNISDHIIFGAQSRNAYYNIEDHFMPAVSSVKKLLNDTTIKVSIYSGQLDLVCPTVGTVNWINRMTWNNKESYVKAQRNFIIIDDIVEGYKKSGGNLSMYWINRAGHYVFLDNLKVMNYILKNITNFG